LDVGNMGKTGTHRIAIRALLIVAVVAAAYRNVAAFSGNYSTASAAVRSTPACETLGIFGTWRGQLPLARELRQSQEGADTYNGEVSYKLAYFSAADQSITETPIFHRLNAGRQAAALRHEYGHALLSDLLNRGALGSYSLSRFELDRVLNLTADDNPGALPEVLRPVWEDFVEARRSNRSIYCTDNLAIAGYYTDHFGEFVAESFGRFCNGDPLVPPRTAGALREIEQIGR